MVWIGLTGGLGSGKSTVAELLRRRGFTVVDADELARRVVEPGSAGLTKVVSRFGPGIVNTNGELDRRRLGESVFKDPVALRDLENILHPLIRELTAKERAQAKARGEKVAFYDVPLLFEKNMQAFFDKVVVVYADLEHQQARAMKRDGFSLSQVEDRLARQIPLAQKRDHADFVVTNTGDLPGLEQQIDRLVIWCQAVFTDAQRP